MKCRKGTFVTSKGYTAKLAQPKYKKYRVTASGTIEIENTTAGDLKHTTFLMVEGNAIKAKITVKRVKKENFDPNIPSEGHL